MTALLLLLLFPIAKCGQELFSVLDDRKFFRVFQGDDRNKLYLDWSAGFAGLENQISQIYI